MGPPRAAGRGRDAVKTIKDFVVYFSQLVRDGIFIAVTFAEVIAFFVKSAIPLPRRPAILDESWVYLAILATGFVIAAFRLHRDLDVKASLTSRERRALRKELREKVIRLKFTIEGRKVERIPVDQALEILGLAKELGDGYLIAECEEIKGLLERNHDSQHYIENMSRNSRRDYESVIARTGYILNWLEKTVGDTNSGNPVA